jgi:hypothetical protein
MTATVPTAWAYRSATVRTDRAEMKQSADPSSPTVAILPKGTRVNTSDRSTQGYYRARSAKASGWLSAGDLAFRARAVKPRSSNSRLARSSSKKRSEHENFDLTLKAFVGANLFKPSDIDSAVGSDALNNGIGVGGEFSFRLSNDWFLAFRIEHLSKSSSGPSEVADDPSATAQVDLSLSSTPVMVGVDYRWLRFGEFSVDASGLIGLGLSTQLNGSVNSTSTPVQFKATPFTALFKLGLNWEFSNSFWLFGDLGYRVLKTSQMTPTTEGDSATNSFFRGSGGTGDFVPIALDLGGPVLDFGIRLNF